MKMTKGYTTEFKHRIGDITCYVALDIVEGRAFISISGPLEQVVERLPTMGMQLVEGINGAIAYNEEEE